VWQTPPDMPTSPYTVSLTAFEGPFDLLLHLIGRRKLDVHDIPIAQITDDYLAVLKASETVDLEVTTEFLVVAATLVELKAARLLPGEDDPELEELALEARDLLYARLLDYRTFKEAAGWVRDRFDAQVGSWPRSAPLEPRFARLRPDAELPAAGDLALLAARALAERPAPVVDLSHVQPARLTVREACGLVLGRLDHAGTAVPFDALTAGWGRADVVVGFLALLELYKLELIDLDQDGPDAELAVRRADAPARSPEAAAVAAVAR